MASRSLGTLTIDLIAKTGGFVQGMSKAERESKRWRNEVQKDLSAVSRSLKIAGTAAVVGLGAMITQTVKTAKEVSNLATVAGTTPQALQRFAFAAERLGLPIDKVADILKDVNDKVGDFLQTGGGPLKDFFENIAPAVGVTAEQFKGLAGDEALGLYVSSLEKANLSQSEMTFFMEAIANDATLLTPLFKDNSRELKRLSDQADEFGVVLSDIELTQLKAVGENVAELKGAFTGLTREVSLVAIPAVEDLTNFLADPATLEAAKTLANGIVKAFTAAGEALKTTVGLAKFLGQELAAAVGGIAGDDIIRLEAKAEKLRDLIEKPFNLRSGAQEKELAEIESQISAYYKNQEELARQQARKLKEITTDSAGEESAERIKAARQTAEIVSKIETEADRKKMKAAQASADAAKAAADAVDSAFASAEAGYKRQIALIGETSEASALLQDIERGRLVGINDAQQKRLIELAKELDSINDLQSAQERYARLVESLKTDAERTNDTLRERLMILDQMSGLSDSERTDTLSRIVEDTSATAPDFAGLDSSVGGVSSEIGKIDEARIELESWYETQLEMLASFRSDRADLNAVWDEQELALTEERDAKLDKINEARSAAQLVAAADLAGSLTNIARQFAGEQSGIYKALFLVEQSISIARSIAAINTAIALAAASGPPPFNFAAIAGVAAATAGLVGNIAALNVQGQAHDGIDSVPATGTWILEKGERVTTSKTSAKLDRTLEEVKARGGGNMQLSITVENHGTNVRAETQQTDEKSAVVRLYPEFRRLMANDIARGGNEAARSLESTYPNLSRAGI